METPYAMGWNQPSMGNPWVSSKSPQLRVICFFWRKQNWPVFEQRPRMTGSDYAHRRRSFLGFSPQNDYLTKDFLVRISILECL